MFRRKVYDKLLEWKATSNGKTALLIEEQGVSGRQRSSKSSPKMNISRTSWSTLHLPRPEWKNYFMTSVDLDYLFLQLQLQFKADLHERRSLIIFDEVQLCPQARQAIKKLVQDGRYDYIETGSLISIKKNVQISWYPVRKERSKCFPWILKNFFGQRAIILLMSF